MEFKIILSDREISLDLALYTTLALFVIVLLAVFFWIFMTCQNWSESGRNSRTRNTVDYYPVHIGRRHCTLLDYQKYAYPQNMQSFQNSACKKYSIATMKVNRNPSKSSSKYNTNSTVCELPIVEVQGLLHFSLYSHSNKIITLKLTSSEIKINAVLIMHWSIKSV